MRISRLMMAAVAALMALTPAMGCKIELGGDETSTTEDDDDGDRKRRDSDDDDDDDDGDKGEKGGDTKEASAAGEIDVDSLLNDSDETHGLLTGGPVELGEVKVKKAPRLRANKKGLRTARWLPLPGDTLEVPNPKTWEKKRKGRVAYFTPKDKSVFVYFTTFRNSRDMGSAQEIVGTFTKGGKVAWKKRRRVLIGDDKLPALVQGGRVQYDSGSRARLLVAAIDTGGKENIFAVAFAKDTAEARKRALGLITNIRKIRKHRRP